MKCLNNDLCITNAIEDSINMLIVYCIGCTVAVPQQCSWCFVVYKLATVVCFPIYLKEFYSFWKKKKHQQTSKPLQNGKHSVKEFRIGTLMVPQRNNPEKKLFDGFWCIFNVKAFWRCIKTLSSTFTGCCALSNGNCFDLRGFLLDKVEGL